MTPAGAAAPDGPRQHLRRRQDRRRARRTTSARATSPRCASWPCCGWPTGSTRALERYRERARHRRPRGRPASASWSRSPAAPEGDDAACGGPRGSPRARPAASCIGVHVDPAGRAGRTSTRAGSTGSAPSCRGARRHVPHGRRRRRRPRRILDFARAENATQIVIGASRRSRCHELLRPGVGRAGRSRESGRHRRPHRHPRPRAADGSRAVRPRQPRGSAAGAGPRASLLGRRRAAAAEPGCSARPHGPARPAHRGDAAVPGRWSSRPRSSVGCCPARRRGRSAALLLVNCFFTPPLYTLHDRRAREPRRPRALRRRRRRRRARSSTTRPAGPPRPLRARAEADALTASAHSLLTPRDDLPGCSSLGLPSLRRRAALRCCADDDGLGRRSASCGRPPASTEQADLGRRESTTTPLVLRRRRRCRRRPATCSTRSPALRRGRCASAALATVAEPSAARAGRGQPQLGPPCWPRCPTTCAPRSRHQGGRRPACAARRRRWSPRTSDELLGDHRGVDRPAHRAGRPTCST